MIEVIWTTSADEDVDRSGYEIEIPFYKWIISVSVKDGEDSNADEDITIYDGVHDVTEDFLMFNETAEIKPNGMNLFQIMDLLKTNMKKGGG